MRLVSTVVAKADAQSEAMVHETTATRNDNEVMFIGYWVIGTPILECFTSGAIVECREIVNGL